MNSKSINPILNVSLISNQGEIVLSELEYKYLVLFFYPKDMTPGCTLEAIDFSKKLNQFHSLNVAVIGVSRDSVASHDTFCAKHSLTLPLISDENEFLCNHFAVLKEKSLFGKKSVSVVRSTFLLDLADKTIVKEWRKVNFLGHANEVLQYVTALHKS